jgi:hypothetical protein
MRNIRRLTGSILALAASSALAADHLVQIPVLKGENLMDVVHRTHPCPFKPGDNSLQKVIRYNPESVGADGRFVLTQKALHVPESFLETAESCRTPASALLQVEGHESGGGKAIVTEPKELSGREHGEEVHSLNVFRIGTFLEYSKLSSTSNSGNSVDLTSKPEYGIDLEYDRWLSRALFVGAHYRQAHSAFQELEERELKEDTTTLRSAGITTGYDLGKKTFFTLELSAVQIDHAMPDVETVTVEHIWVPKLSFGIKSVFAEVAGLEIGGGLTGSLYLPARGTAKTSPAENAELFVERELSPLLTVELGLGAQFVRQGFEDGSHSFTSYGADLGLGIHF